MTSCNRIFNRISNPLTVVSWNSNIRAAVDNGCSKKALLVFRQMKESGIQPDNFTFPFIAKACARLSHLQNSEIIHSHIAKSPFSSDIFVQTAMVDMYAKCHRLDSAHAVFIGMPERDVASWNVIIVGFSQLGLLDRVLDLFHQMRLANFKPDSITIISLTQSSANMKNLNVVKAVHSLGIHTGVKADTSVANTWIAAYAKCNDLDSAESVFNGISMAARTVVSWNSMIAGYAYLDRFIEVICFFRRMCKDGTRPDLSTILSLLSACARSGSLLQGQLIHSWAIKEGFDLDVLVVNTLISMYSKCGDVISARFLFDKMLDRTCVSWTVMIGGYAQKGDVDEALELFYAMEAAGVKPDAVTVVAVLSACSQTGALDLGRWINRYAIANGLIENVMVSNAVVDMYAKCGSIDEARGLFNSMPGKTIVSWTTMIAGYAMNGDFEEAFDLFSRMVKSGLKPNCVTFLAVLQACTHAGFLEKGLEYFNLMVEIYQLRPELEHYACMADLLGRSGRVKQALEFIQSMPVEPDAGLWGALLGACRIHNAVEVGEYVADHLFMIESQTAVSYVAMANIYAALGRWEGVAKIRAMMKSKGVRKLPGRSLIRVNGKVHAFTVEDRHHPEGFQIYEVLGGLALQLKEAGFRPNSIYVLLEEWE
ncbi:pentatricopeptide repeat-containing protein At4g19191, mitochondrial-like [Magnolia sinica]|uniref:pentatricopeptide repeat-containing protein At4g19191, mitochondrial-like n=1 Tax=Magnolia sinica TaxID=86752 RepID=UPI00265AA9F1|nr:pentatricopeptide repeat-containing protein At4g19191, mitochondrial-like [Magnolia sinica]